MHHSSFSKIFFSFSCLYSTETVEIHLHTYMAAAAKGKRKYHLQIHLATANIIQYHRS